MDGAGAAPRRVFGLVAYERYFVALGIVAVSVAALLATREPLPPLGTLLILAALSAASVHWNIADNDEPVGMAFSAQGMVVAAAAVTFRSSSPLLGPLLVGMAAALWRVPRTRHEWFTIPGNFGSNGLSACAAAVALGAVGLGSAPSALILATVAGLVAVSYALINGTTAAMYARVAHGATLREFATETRGHVLGLYVPFVFGAFVGEWSLRFGVVVFGAAAAMLLLIQAVFAAVRRETASERELCEGIIAAVERKDAYLAGHSKRVEQYAGLMARQLGFKGRAARDLEHAALMHDVGKLVVPNHILGKPGKLTAAEREVMRSHEPAGALMLSRIRVLASGASIAAGEGHSDALDGPVAATHVVHVADAYDAMTSTRAYRRAHDADEAFAELRAHAGEQGRGQFHPAVVEGLISGLRASGSLVIDHDETAYEVPPPDVVLGDTLDAQDDAERVQPAEVPPTVVAPPADLAAVAAARRSRPSPVRASVRRVLAMGAAGWFVVAAALAVGAAATVVPDASGVLGPVGLGALVAACELVVLRPLRRGPRPLSLVVMLVAAASLSPGAALAAIAGGVIAAAVVEPSVRRRLVSRLCVGAVMVGALAGFEYAWSAAPNAAVTFGSLLVACVVGLVVQECFDTAARRRWRLEDRLADLALLACAPLAALGTAGVAGRGGLGLGALAVVAIPLGLLSDGFVRTQRARANQFEWVRAVSIAPEFAGLVSDGRAERVAGLCVQVADAMGLDGDARDQLEAAAWMERVGECCLDETFVSGRPHYQEDIVEESAAILKATVAFYEAGQILYAMLREPEEAAITDIDWAGQILRAVVAYENATNGEPVALGEVPGLFARLRTAPHHQLDCQISTVLQDVVAPGSKISQWCPVRWHARLACGHVRSVEDDTIGGDSAYCTVHGETTVDELVFDALTRVRDDRARFVTTTVEILGRAEPSGCIEELQRELYVRFAGDLSDLDAVALLTWAGFRAGHSWENQVARWMRETGASPHETAAVLSYVGTSGFEAFEAIAAAYLECEVDAWNERVLAGPSLYDPATYTRATPDRARAPVVWRPSGTPRQLPVVPRAPLRAADANGFDLAVPNAPYPATRSDR